MFCIGALHGINFGRMRGRAYHDVKGRKSGGATIFGSAWMELKWMKRAGSKAVLPKSIRSLRLTDKNPGTISSSHLNTCAEIIHLQNASVEE